MKILIDIKHPAQLNLFKGLSKELVQKGWDVTISYLDRGKLPKIIDREYGDFKRLPIGRSRGSKWSIFWEGNVMRTMNFFKLIRQHKYNICISASSIPLAYACYFSRKPIIQFYDDPERKGVNKINAFFSNRLFFPPIVTESKKVGIFNCLKEWSYLSPARFKPSKKILEEYGLQEHEYIFVREVSNKSFNYMNQQDAIVRSFADRIKPGVKVILSLEDKSIADKYPKDWVILQEPVSDIHSLIYYSKLVISSGDSMAREGAMLGVQAVYCGIREMKANQLLIDEGILHHQPIDAGVDFINERATKTFDVAEQENIRQRLKDKWVDMIDFMHTQINSYKR
jgi:predicted glycosyltransferase